jgi:hypothetical protein
VSPFLERIRVQPVSGVYNNHALGTGFARSMIDSPLGWAAGWPHPIHRNLGRERSECTSILRSVRFTVGVVTRKDEWIAAASGLRPIPSRGAPVRLVGRSVRNEAGSSTFTGNTGQVDTHVQHAPLFSNSVTTRSVRFSPLSWHSHMTMRAGLPI